LEFLGDCGGLMDMLALLASLVLAPYTTFVLKQFVGTSLFFERKTSRAKNQREETSEKIKADFDNRQVIQKLSLMAICKCKSKAYR